jgi:molecular chaperone DnaJ
MSSRDLKIVTINAKLNITPEEALNGITKVLFQITKNILYRKTVLCGSCHGKSSEAKKIKCKKCSGSGFVGKGLDDIRCCSACNGNGTVRNQGCKECRGKGNVEIYAEEAVRVPAHSLQNQEIVLKGRGNQHPKKFYYGDVYIKLKISNKPLIKVDGMNTFSEVKLSISEAILGAKIEYPTLKGNKHYEVQKGMADNEEVVIRGEGLKKGNKIGDHYLKLKIHIPKSVSKQEEEIFMKLRDIEKRKSKSSHK